jgi:uncharacterized protein HemY
VPRRAFASPAFRVVAVVVVCFIVVSGMRAGHWKDSLTLWQTAQRQTSFNLTVMNQLGIAYAQAGKWGEAEAVFLRMIAHGDRSTTPVTNLMILARSRQDEELVTRYLEWARVLVGAGLAHASDPLGWVVSGEGMPSVADPPAVPPGP